MSLFGLETIDVVVLCGGQGTRLRALTTSTPKPLLPVGGTPFLLRRLVAIQRENVRIGRILLAVHYLAEQFVQFLQTYSEQLPRVTIINEPAPLGTGGALRHAASHIHSTKFIALNGDSWLLQPLAPVIAQHAQFSCALTMVVVHAARVSGGAHAKGLVSIGPRGQILGFATGDATHDGWVNAGCYVIEKRLVLGWPSGRYDLEREFTSLVPSGHGAVFRSEESLLDIGTPTCYAQANQLLSSSEIVTSTLPG